MRRFALLGAGLALLAGVAATLSGGETQANARWVITDLGTLGGPNSWAVASNQRGRVVGYADTKARGGQYHEPIKHAFLWQNGKMIDLGTLGGPSSMARDINERGQVVGLADTKARDKDGYPIRHAFLWQNGKMIDLGALGGRYSHADAINDRGQVIGRVDPKAGGNHAFLWQDGKMRDLGTLGGTESEAAAINERGQIVGSSDTKGRDRFGITVTHAFLWQNGQMIDLGTLGGTQSEAAAINERGQIVGEAATNEGSIRAFLWQNGKMRDLGTRYGKAVAINERGQVVGTSETKGRDKDGEPIWRPFLWQNGKMRNLGAATLGERYSEAVAVNDRAQVLVQDPGVEISTVDPTWGEHAFLWQQGKLTALRPLPGWVDTTASALSNSGQIVGWSDSKNDKTHAVLWTPKRG